MTKLSRWIGVLEIVSSYYEDNTPIFYPEDDPFIIRFEVKPIAWLNKENAIPIHDDQVWNTLSFTRDHRKDTSTWTGIFRGSLNRLEAEDAQFLQQLILDQAETRKVFPLDEDEYRKLVKHRVRRTDKTVTVSVPQDLRDQEEEPSLQTERQVRDSIKMQARLAEMGAKMGFSLWIPFQDRSNVAYEWQDDEDSLLDTLPLNYDEATLRTIEQIDVIWLRGRSIVRAFEVEHTTSIYSGIPRMADLLALQPNMDIKLHIIAPDSRRDKVFSELQRPVFTLLEKGPLYEICTYLSYDSINKISNLSHLQYLSDSVLEEYAEEVE
jgi:hypothetical protein